MDLQVNDRQSAPLAVSVIIPVHNGGRAFVQCLRALRQSPTQPREIIVAANGCRDRTAEAARLAGATVIETPRAVGPAAARNAAARQACGDLLFFVDADVAVHPDALDRLLTCFELYPDIAACFGSYDNAPPEKNFLSQYKNLFHHFVHQSGKTNASTFWAGCGAVRRDIFLAMGGFDETYRRPAIEDIELGQRLAARGHLIHLDKKLLATHLKRWRLTGLLYADIFQRALPWCRLILRTGSVPNDLNTGYRSRASVFLALLLALLLATALFSDKGLLPAAFIGSLLLFLNLDWYRFVFRRKGLVWTIQAAGWHWFYYLYSGVALIWALIEHLIAHCGLRRTT
jgi:glycosyltransferase involved in cell wall biosynthesis